MVSKALNTFSKVMDLVTPDGQTSKLTFKKYKGSALLELAKNPNMEFADDDISTIVLNVNPDSLTYTRPKVVQKVQTISAQHFIIFDWGTDLLDIKISGNTGQLLPPEVVNKFMNNYGTVSEILNVVDPSILASPGNQAVSGVFTGITQYTNDVLFGSMSYDDLIQLSPTYQTFVSLIELYNTFDADRDVLTLQIGNAIYRGYFTTFDFNHQANSPWNYKYNIGFMSLINLTDLRRRNDPAYNKNKVKKQ